MSSQEFKVVSTNELPQNEPSENGEAENGLSFRIRNVQEINSEAQNEASSTELGKRKLPVWLDPTDETNNKKSKKSTQSEKRASTSRICNEENEANNRLNNNLVSSTQVHEELNNMPDSNECNEPEASENEQNREDLETKPHVMVKIEKEETNEACASTNNGSPQISPNPVKVEVKTENTTDEVVVKEEATSSLRESCKFGIRCYRRNPAHRFEMAHPGDNDYRRPDFPPPPKGTPDCPFGDRCYRRNPIHFQEYSHPPSTDFEKNWKLRQKRLRKQKKDPQYQYFDDDDDEDESESDDPFETDASDDEYVPSD